MRLECNVAEFLDKYQVELQLGYSLAKRAATFLLDFLSANSRCASVDTQVRSEYLMKSKYSRTIVWRIISWYFHSIWSFLQ